MMTELSKIKKITILILFLFIGPNNLNAAIFPDFVIPDEEILEILKLGHHGFLGLTKHLLSKEL